MIYAHRSFVVLALFASLVARPAQACDGTWKLDPVDDNWNNAANWSDNCVPDDVPHFGVSNLVDITVTEGAFPSNLDFQVGASSYIFTVPARRQFIIEEESIQNLSGVEQHFEMLADASGQSATFDLQSSFSGISAGTGMVFTTHGGRANGGDGGFIIFHFESDAGSATLVNNGGEVSGAKGGTTIFFVNGSANRAAITNKAGLVAGALGGTTIFGTGTHGGSSHITCEGAMISG
ncbi:MAG: hypothetical protein M3Q46_13030, partial [Verrucomicrobiota bacterium]|nr:hypothetical protein [Verrucomicrobiota bacterium]